MAYIMDSGETSFSANPKSRRGGWSSSGSSIKRIGRDRFLRNCCISAGNSNNKNLLPDIIKLLMDDKSSIVRGAAVWAFQQLSDKELYKHIKVKHLNIEKDTSVIQEWT